MTKEEKDKIREILDQEMSFGFRMNNWAVARSLLHYAELTELVSFEEYKWLKDSMECLG